MQRVKRIVSIVLMLSVMLAAIPAFSIGASADVVAYSQYSEPWCNWVYGGGNIADTGCGIVSTANVLNYLKGGIDVGTFIDRLATWAHNRGAFNPGNSDDGTYRTSLYPYMEEEFGSEYGFTVGDSYWTGSSSSALKEHLAGGGVAVGHVYGHFIGLVSYDSSDNTFLVLDSAPSYNRGTPNGVAWLSEYELGGYYEKMILDWFCLISSNGSTPNPPTPSDPVVPYEENGEYYFADCNSLTGWSTEFSTNLSLEVANSPVGNYVVMDATDCAAADVGSMAFYRYDSAGDAARWNYISFEIYCSIDYSTAGRDSDFFQVNFFSGEGNQDGYNINIPASSLTEGWHTFTYKKSSLSRAIDGANWSSITGLRFTWFNYSRGGDVTFAVDTVKAFYGDVAAYTTDENTLMVNDCDEYTGWTTAWGSDIGIQYANNPPAYYIEMLNNGYDGEDQMNNGVGGMLFYDYTVQNNMSEYDDISLELYCSIDYASSGRNDDHLQINFTSSRDNQDGFNYDIPASDIHSGWQVITIPKSAFKMEQEASWDNIWRIRFTWFNDSKSSQVDFAFDTIKAVKSESVKAYEENGELLFADCNKLTGWSTEFATNLSLEPATSPAGNYVVMDATDCAAYDVGSMAFYRYSEACNASDYNYISFEIFCSIDYTTAGRDSDFFQINFFSGDSNQDGYNINVPASKLTQGWNTFTFKKSSLPRAIDDVNWSAITGMRFTWFNYSRGSDVTFAVDTVKAYKGDVAAYTVDDNTMILNDCDETTGWWPAWGSSLGIEYAVNPAGYCIKMYNDGCKNQSNVDNGVGGMLFYDYTVSNNLSAYDTISLEVYSSIDYASSGRNDDHIEVNFTASHDNQDGYNYNIPCNSLHEGWQFVTIPASDFVLKQDTNWNDIHRIRITWFNDSQGDAVTLGFDTIKAIKTSVGPVVPVTSEAAPSGKILKVTYANSDTQMTAGYKFLDLAAATVYNGYRFVYDVYLCDDVKGIGGIDVDNGSACYARDNSAYVDQNSVSGHPSSDISDYAYHKWFRRVLTLPTDWNGSNYSNFFTLLAFDGGFTGNATAYFDNIKLVDANGNDVEYFFLDGGNEYSYVNNCVSTNGTESNYSATHWEGVNASVVDYQTEFSSSPVVTVNVKLDNNNWANNTKVITLRGSNGTVSASNTGAALTFSAANGTYTIYDGSKSTGVSVTVNGSSTSKTLNYYTISTCLSNEGCASVTAKYGGTAVNNGDIVLTGKTLELTASSSKEHCKCFYSWSNGATTNVTTTNDVGNPPLVTVECILWGDVDGNGQVDVADALMILQHAVGKKTITGKYAEVGNVDADSSVSSSDALCVLQFAVKNITAFPAESK